MNRQVVINDLEHHWMTRALFDLTVTHAPYVDAWQLYTALWKFDLNSNYSANFVNWYRFFEFVNEFSLRKSRSLLLLLSNETELDCD